MPSASLTRIEAETREPFADRHIGPGEADLTTMLASLGAASLADLASVRNTALPGAVLQLATATGLGMALAWGFGWTPADIGFSLAMVGLCSALVQGALIRAVIPRLGERRALLVGLLLNIGGFVGFAFAARGWMIYAIIVPFSLGGISGPAVQALLSREIGPDEQGELQGALASLNSLTSIAGALIGTRLFERLLVPRDALTRRLGEPPPLVPDEADPPSPAALTMVMLRSAAST